jgi:hypothetical protein
VTPDNDSTIPELAGTGITEDYVRSLESGYDESKAEVARLQAQVEAAKACHQKVADGEYADFCRECIHNWPCPTIAALGEEEG